MSGGLRGYLRLRDDLGFAVPFITHDLPLLLQVSDRIAVVLDAEIVECGTADDVRDRPRQPYTRRLLDSFPSLTDERGAFVRTGGPVPPGGSR